METHIRIPSEVAGRAVTEIGADAFPVEFNLDHQPPATRIDIPDSVTDIADGAFASCDELSIIYVSPDHPTLAVIDGVLFGKADRRLIHYPRTFTATSYQMPDSIREIGFGAFGGCDALISVTLPENVEIIGDYAFSYCAGLTSVTFNGNVGSVGVGAFMDCTALTSVTFNGNVGSIGDYAFAREKTVPLPYADLISVTFNGNVGSIGECAFESCTGLNSVTFNGSVGSIGDYAFELCQALRSVTLPEGLKHIGDYAFSSCVLMTSIYLPEGLKHIGDYAFSSCAFMTSIHLPSSIESIGIFPFEGCSALTLEGVVVEGPRFEVIDGVLYDHEEKKLVCVLPGIFWSDVDKEYTVPEGTKEIPNYFFYDGANCLKRIVLPEGLVSVGEYAVNVSEPVELPASLVHLGKKAFTSDDRPELIVSPGNPGVFIRDGMLFTDYGRTLYRVLDTDAEGLVVPQGVTCIEQDSIQAGNLRWISIPASVTELRASIPAGVFVATPADSAAAWKLGRGGTIDSVESERSCGDYLYFVQQDGTAVITGYTGSAKTLDIPSSLDGLAVTRIGPYAFAEVKLDSVVLPASVTSLGGTVFKKVGCITIPESVTSFERTSIWRGSGCFIVRKGTAGSAYAAHWGIKVEYVDSFKHVCGDYIYECAEDGTAIILLYTGSEERPVIPETLDTHPVSAIADGAFAGCGFLRAVTIPDSVSAIGETAFADCPPTVTFHVGRGSFAAAWCAGRGYLCAYPDYLNWLAD